MPTIFDCFRNKSSLRPNMKFILLGMSFFKVLLLVVVLSFRLSEGELFHHGNTTLPEEYQLREKLIRSGCWPLNNIPDVFPIMNQSELPLTVKIMPFFEIVSNVDDKAQT